MDVLDLYALIADWAGWPAVVAVLLLLGSYCYWIKNNRIEGLNEKNDYLKDQINDLQNYTPDALARRLFDRHKVLSEELEKMVSEQEASEKEIEQKEAQIAENRERILELGNQLNDAQTVLDELTEKFQEFTCLYCGSLLEAKEYPDAGWEGGNHEWYSHIIEVKTFACGLTLEDGKEVGKCRNRAD